MRKKTSTLLAALVLAVMLAGCGQGGSESKGETAQQTDTSQEEASSQEDADEEDASPSADAGEEEPALPEDASLDTVIHVAVDGKEASESGYTYADLSEKMAALTVAETDYYGITLADLTGQDLSECKGAFLEATDGYVTYVSDIEGLALAAFAAGEEGYDYITLEDANVYGAASVDGALLAGVENIYLVTTPADFSVDIQINGESAGTMTINEFMKKTHAGEEKIPTAMFDGSFLYQQGAATYSGRFLGINYETMMAKIGSMEGVELPAEIKEVEYYGTPGMGEPGKNTEYALTPDEDTYFGAVDFFCMYDGMTLNAEIKDAPVGLSVFTNGTGSRWLTYNLTAINIVTE